MDASLQGSLGNSLFKSGMLADASWSRHILLHRRVLLRGLFRHNFAENGLQDLKMISKDASRNSTKSVIKNQLLNKNIGKVMKILVLRCQKLRSRRAVHVCTTEILVRYQLVTGVVSGDPRQIEP